MKKLFKSIRDRTQGFCVRVHSTLRDRRGDIAVSTIGGIIITVVVIGLLILAINAFFPGFFNSMFNNMRTRLNAHW